MQFKKNNHFRNSKQKRIKGDSMIIANLKSLCGSVEDEFLF